MTTFIVNKHVRSHEPDLVLPCSLDSRVALAFAS